MAWSVSGVFDEALAFQTVEGAGIRLSAHAAEEHIRAVFTFTDGVARLTPWQFVSAWVRWQNSRKGGAGYTVFNDGKVLQATATYVAAMRHGLVTSKGVGRRRRIFLTHPDEQVYERCSNGGSRIVARSMLTRAEAAQLEADHRRRDARRAAVWRRHALENRPYLVRLLVELASWTRTGHFDGLVPPELIALGWVPEYLAGRSLASVIEVLGDLPLDWPIQKQLDWHHAIAFERREVRMRMPALELTSGPAEPGAADIPDEDAGALGTLAW